MRIVAIHERTVELSSATRNSSISFDAMTASVIAVHTDTKREGRPGRMRKPKDTAAYNAPVQIDEFLRREIGLGTFPGASYAIGSAEGIEHAGAVGNAVAVPLRLPATVDTIYDCASMTKALITTNTWTGLNDRATEGSFIWVDGTAVSFTDFATGEPNNAGNVFQEDCVIWAPARPGWDDRPCDNADPIATSPGSYPYLCMF